MANKKEIPTNSKGTIKINGSEIPAASYLGEDELLDQNPREGDHELGRSGEVSTDEPSESSKSDWERQWAESRYGSWLPTKTVPFEDFNLQFINENCKSKDIEEDRSGFIPCKYIILNMVNGTYYIDPEAEINAVIQPNQVLISKKKGVIILCKE